MAYQGSADVNFHHKEVVLLDFTWVNKPLVVHVEMRQFEEEEHQGHAPALLLCRTSPAGNEDILLVSGRTGANILVSLDHQQKLVAKTSSQNPNSAGTVKWEIVA